MNNAGLTDRQFRVLKQLGAYAIFDLPGQTCRQVSMDTFGSHQPWTMKTLRWLELRKFVEKARPDQFNNIRWKITDAGLERLARDTGNETYRDPQRTTGGTAPSP